MRQGEEADLSINKCCTSSEFARLFVWREQVVVARGESSLSFSRADCVTDVSRGCFLITALFVPLFNLHWSHCSTCIRVLYRGCICVSFGVSFCVFLYEFQRLLCCFCLLPGLGLKVVFESSCRAVYVP